MARTDITLSLDASQLAKSIDGLADFIAQSKALFEAIDGIDWNWDMDSMRRHWLVHVATPLNSARAGLQASGEAQ